MMTGKLFQGFCISKKALEEAMKMFPMVDDKDKPIYSETLKWFTKYFGDEEKVKALLDGYFAEYLAAHLRDSNG